MDEPPRNVAVLMYRKAAIGKVRITLPHKLVKPVRHMDNTMSIEHSNRFKIRMTHARITNRQISNITHVPVITPTTALAIMCRDRRPSYAPAIVPTNPASADSTAIKVTLSG
ncbi:MAG: hypothetical protein BroJett018_29320 [Chloroflexota bacterium]|nr:MAG: hypothetical protein BroJett018_29320 [Chloroflexota bacterium]